MDDAEAAGRAVKVGSNFFLFFTSRPNSMTVRDGAGGAVTVIQRFGGGRIRASTVTPSYSRGMFTETGDGTLHFVAAPAPADDEVARVLATIVRRVRRFLQ